MSLNAKDDILINRVGYKHCTKLAGLIENSLY